MKRKLIVYTLIMSVLVWGGMEILGSPDTVAETKTISVNVSATVPPIFQVSATPQQANSENQINIEKETTTFNVISSTREKPQIIRERKPDKIVYSIYNL